ncbi:MAG: hypothetical protein SOV48_16645 [Intestinibacter sp.]|nr:hypothetical protein [Intestinibacter sp.]
MAAGSISKCIAPSIDAALAQDSAPGVFLFSKVKALADAARKFVLSLNASVLSQIAPVKAVALNSTRPLMPTSIHMPLPNSYQIFGSIV